MIHVFLVPEDSLNLPQPRYGPIRYHTCDNDSNPNTHPNPSPDSRWFQIPCQQAEDEQELLDEAGLGSGLLDEAGFG